MSRLSSFLKVFPLICALLDGGLTTSWASDSDGEEGRPSAPSRGASPSSTLHDSPGEESPDEGDEAPAAPPGGVVARSAPSSSAIIPGSAPSAPVGGGLALAVPVAPYRRLAAGIGQEGAHNLLLLCEVFAPPVSALGTVNAENRQSMRRALNCFFANALKAKTRQLFIEHGPRGLGNALVEWFIKGQLLGTLVPDENLRRIVSSFGGKSLVKSLRGLIRGFSGSVEEALPDEYAHWWRLAVKGECVDCALNSLILSRLLGSFVGDTVYEWDLADRFQRHLDDIRAELLRDDVVQRRLGVINQEKLDLEAESRNLQLRANDLRARASSVEAKAQQGYQNRVGTQSVLGRIGGLFSSSYLSDEENAKAAFDKECQSILEEIDGNDEEILYLNTLLTSLPPGLERRSTEYRQSLWEAMAMVGRNSGFGREGMEIYTSYVPLRQQPWVRYFLEGDSTLGVYLMQYVGAPYLRLTGISQAAQDVRNNVPVLFAQTLRTRDHFIALSIAPANAPDANARPEGAQAGGFMGALRGVRNALRSIRDSRTAQALRFTRDYIASVQETTQSLTTLATRVNNGFIRPVRFGARFFMTMGTVRLLYAMNNFMTDVMCEEDMSPCFGGALHYRQLTPTTYLMGGVIIVMGQELVDAALSYQESSNSGRR